MTDEVSRSAQRLRKSLGGKAASHRVTEPN
jgi:hypothetical protein